MKNVASWSEEKPFDMSDDNVRISVKKKTVRRNKNVLLLLMHFIFVWLMVSWHTIPDDFRLLAHLLTAHTTTYFTFNHSPSDVSKYTIWRYCFRPKYNALMNYTIMNRIFFMHRIFGSRLLNFTSIISKRIQRKKNQKRKNAFYFWNNVFCSNQMLNARLLFMILFSRRSCHRLNQSV